MVPARADVGAMHIRQHVCDEEEEDTQCTRVLARPITKRHINLKRNHARHPLFSFSLSFFK